MEATFEEVLHLLAYNGFDIQAASAMVVNHATYSDPRLLYGIRNVWKHPRSCGYESLFHVAVRQRRRKRMDELLEAGYNIDTQNHIGCSTPLIHAIIHDSLEMVELLCEKGADINKPIEIYTNTRPKPPILYVCPLVSISKRKNIVRYLATQKGIHKEAAFEAVCRIGDLPLIRHFIEEEGAVINRLYGGWTPHMCVAYTGEEEALRYLLGVNDEQPLGPREVGQNFMNMMPLLIKYGAEFGTCYSLLFSYL